LNPTGYAQVLEEHVSQHSSAPSLQSVYAYGHTLISQDRLDNATWRTSFYGYDGHNNVRYLTDLNAIVTDTYDYDAFGNLIGRTGNTPNHYLFTGEQFDSDLGVYYLRARYHNPNTGRFWSMDGFEGYGSDPSSLHKYTYCGNSPVNACDPSGHATIPELSIATGLWATARAIFGATIGGTTGALAAGYDSILHGRVSNQEIAQAMTGGFREGAIAGAFFGAVGTIGGSVGSFGLSAVGMVYSGIGFLSAYQSYSSGNIEAGDFEAAMAALGAATSTPGLARGSVFGVRGLTSALERYYGGSKSFLNIHRIPAELANEGYKYPPFAGDAIEFQTGRDMYFVRLRTPLNKLTGKWLAAPESVIGKTPAQLKQLFALEEEPNAIQVVRVPRGTKMSAGRIASQPQWGVPADSDAIQYQLGNGIDPDNFSTKTVELTK
jgi:RHS repeat-associated protein